MYKNVPENKQAEFHNRVKLAQAPLSVYKCPETAEDYWRVVDNYWSYLLAILEQFPPEIKLEDMLLRGEILSPSDLKTRLKENRDVRLVEYFNRAWTAAPDNGSIHLIPGWGILCDLCSEGYLVYEV